MSIFSFIGDLFKPASDLVDELHFSGEEQGNIEIKKSELRNKLAEMESKVSIKMMDLQSQAIEANSKVAIAEQEHGNWLSKSWRPITSLALVGLLLAMGFEIVPYKDFLAKVAGGFLGIYGMGRSYEKGKK